MFSLKDPFAWEFFVVFFPHACPHFKSDIHKDNRRPHVKLHNILFFPKYFVRYLKDQNVRSLADQQNHDLLGLV